MRKTTFIALAVFAALAYLAVQNGQKPARRGVIREVIADLNPDAVDRIVVSGHNGITMRRVNDRWLLEDNTRADTRQVRALLDASRFLQADDILATEMHAHFGYDTAGAKAHRVQLMHGNKVLADFVLGKELRGGTAVAVHQLVYRVPRLNPGVFLHDPNVWRELRLFEDGVSELARIDAALLDAEPYSLEKSSGAWQLTRPTGPDGKLRQGLRFDPEQAQTMANALMQMKADRLEDTDPGIEVTGLSDAADTFGLYILGQDPNVMPLKPKYVVQLGKPQQDNSVYARIQGRNELYHLPGFVPATVRKTLRDLRQLSLMNDFDPSTVHTLILTANANSNLRLLRTSTDWALGDETDVPPNYELDVRKVKQRLADLKSVRAQGFARMQDPLRAGVQYPRAMARLYMDGGQVATLAFGASAMDQGRLVYARGTSDQGVYFVTGALRDALLGGIETFRVSHEQSPLATYDQDALAKLPPDVRLGLEKHFREKNREKDMLRKFQQSAQAP